jgi:hypothetical protein
MQAQRRRKGIALLFFNLGARLVGWLTPRLGRFIPENYTISIVLEAGWAPTSGGEKLTPTGIRSPDLPIHRDRDYSVPIIYKRIF